MGRGTVTSGVTRGRGRMSPDQALKPNVGQARSVRGGFAVRVGGVTSLWMSLGAFPHTRLRRTRSAAWSRALVAETNVSPSDLIWPLFIAAGDGAEEPIAALPGVSRWPVAALANRAREARDLGIPCIALFPNTPGGLRSTDAHEALNPDNLICRAIKAVKDAVPEIGILTDVALDPYTADGHDGVTDASGYVLNDETSAILVGQALVQAAAGADIVAPSDMMDGRVGAIRTALEREGHVNVQICLLYTSPSPRDS